KRDIGAPEKTARMISLRQYRSGVQQHWEKDRRSREYPFTTGEDSPLRYKWWRRREKNLPNGLRLSWTISTPHGEGGRRRVCWLGQAIGNRSCLSARWYFDDLAHEHSEDQPVNRRMRLDLVRCPMDARLL